MQEYFFKVRSIFSLYMKEWSHHLKWRTSVNFSPLNISSLLNIALTLLFTWEAKKALMLSKVIITDNC